MPTGSATRGAPPAPARGGTGAARAGVVLRSPAVSPLRARLHGGGPLATDLLAALHAAGVEVVRPEGPPAAALRAPADEGGIEVVLVDGDADGLVALAKRADARRPVLAVGADARALRVCLGGYWGADAALAWPATREALLGALARAAAAARRPRALRWPWVMKLGQAFAFAVVLGPSPGTGPAALAAKATALLAIPLLMLAGVPYSSRPRRDAAFALVLLAASLALVVKLARA